MFRALWYIVKILILVGISVFLLVQPGEININWKEYQITVQLGYAAVALLVLVFFVSLISEVVTRLSLWPKHLARSRLEKNRAKGYRALMKSLSSAAIGDQKSAYDLARRAQKFLSEDESGLPLLLQAQAMSRQGNGPAQENSYKLLLKNADTALLGLQGLTQNAILAGEFDKALALARKAYLENPKNSNLAKAVYDLEIRNHLWNDALVTLDKNKKFLRSEDDMDRSVIYIILGDMAKDQNRPDEAIAFYKRAYKNNSNFPPASTRYINALIGNSERRKALSILEKSWKMNAHPSYIPLWQALVPEQKVGKPNARFRWFQWIVEFHSESEVAHLALARVAIEEGLWGDARAALAQAEKLGKSAEIYKLWVLLEEKTTNKPDVIRQWLDRAYQAKPCGTWLCPKSNKKFAEWQAIVEPEGFFNSLVWITDNQKPESTIISGILESPT